MEKNKRQIQFDIIKLFAIFLVIWGHCIQHFVDRPPAIEPMWRFIYSFHMPLFMVISGYFSLSSMRVSFIEIVKKKSQQLLLPVISWTIIIVLIQNLFNLKPLETKLIDFFWFLESLYLCYILAFVTLRFNTKIAIILSILGSQIIPFFNFPIMYPCFLFGLFVRKQGLLLNLSFKRLIICVIAFVGMMLLIDWNTINGISIKEAILSRDLYQFGLYWVFRCYKIVMGILGSISFIGLFFRIFNESRSEKPIIKFFANLGQYTLGVYLVQAIIISLVLSNFLNFSNINVYLYNFVISPMISIVALILCIVIVKCLYRLRIPRFILFGKK